MMYKVIFNDKIIDVLRYPIFLRFLPFDHVTTTGQTSAHGVAASDGDNLYGLTADALKIRPSAKLVQLEQITEAEYNRLKQLLDEGATISADASGLSQAKEVKLAALSSQCKARIIAGFTVTLADGKAYHFNLTAEDQLNLLRIESQLRSSTSEFFIYHATNQPCTVFSKQDMATIINAAQAHMLYHTTYFNAVKQHINSLTDISAVREFSYGSNVIDAVENSVIKQILKTGGVFS